MLVPDGSYFVSRDNAETSYSDYWGTVEDPDGRVRSRAQDEGQYLEDCRSDLDLVQSMCPPSVLDVGCGPGWFLDSLRAINRRVGTEISRPAIDEARRRGISIYRDIAEVPGGFELIRCHHVIEHVADPVGELAKIRHKLEPGGMLLMSTPDFGGPAALQFGNRYRMLHDKTHRSLFTNESMHRFLRDFGFEVVHVTYPFPDRYVSELALWTEVSESWGPPWPGNWMTFYSVRQ